VCDRFHVFFPFEKPMLPTGFEMVLKMWSILLDRLGVQNDGTHDHNRSAIFFPSRNPGELPSDNFDCFESGSVYVSPAQIKALGDKLGLDWALEMMALERPTEDNHPLQLDAVEEIEYAKCRTAAKKIVAHMIEVGKTGYGDILNVLFSIADMVRNGMVTHDEGLELSVIVSGAQPHLTRDMVAGKFDNCVRSGSGSRSYKTFLQLGLDAGFKGKIIVPIKSVEVGSSWLEENQQLVYEALQSVIGGRVERAARMNRNPHLAFVGGYLHTKNGRIYAPLIRCIEGRYIVDKPADIMPLPIEALIEELKKNLIVSKELIPSIKLALCEFIDAHFQPHSAILTLSASYDRNFNPLWGDAQDKDTETAVSDDGTGTLYCRNPFNPYTGKNLKADADLIMKMVTRILSTDDTAKSKRNIEFYLDWLTLVTYVDCIGRTPVIALKSGRGTGKTLLLEKIPNLLFKNPISSEYGDSDQFQQWQKSKIVYINEASSSSKVFVEANSVIKAITGKDRIILREMRKDPVEISSRCFFVIDSNERQPLQIHDPVTDHAQNQYFCEDLGEAAITTRFSDWGQFMQDTLNSSNARSQVAAFRKVYLEPRLDRVKAQATNRFRLKVPITETFLKWQGSSVSNSTKKAIRGLFNILNAKLTGNSFKVSGIGSPYILDGDTKMIRTVAKTWLEPKPINGVETVSISKEVRLNVLQSNVFANQYGNICDQLVKIGVAVDSRRSLDGKKVRVLNIDYKRYQGVLANIDPSLCD